MELPESKVFGMDPVHMSEGKNGGLGLASNLPTCHKLSIHISCALGSGGWNRAAPTSGAETCPKAPNNRAGSSAANIWVTVTVPDNAMSPVNCARTTEVGDEEVIDALAR